LVVMSVLLEIVYLPRSPAFLRHPWLTVWPMIA
jgi:hypothetical protein